MTPKVFFTILCIFTMSSVFCQKKQAKSLKNLKEDNKVENSDTSTQSQDDAEARSADIFVIAHGIANGYTTDEAIDFVKPTAEERIFYTSMFSSNVNEQNVINVSSMKIEKEVASQRSFLKYKRFIPFRIRGYYYCTKVSSCAVQPGGIGPYYKVKSYDCQGYW